MQLDKRHKRTLQCSLHINVAQTNQVNNMVIHVYRSSINCETSHVLDCFRIRIVTIGRTIRGHLLTLNGHDFLVTH